MRNQMKRTPARALKSLVAMMMVLCLLVGMAPVAFAAQSVGATPDYVSPSRVKTYIQLSVSVPFFTGTLYNTGTVINPVAGTVCQLVSDDWYTGSDGVAYYSVYYLNTRYNVRKSDVEKDILTETALNTYITGTLWKQASYSTLRKNMNLKGDIRVHAVQLALQKLGYYDGDLDGSYGNQTHNAVYKFQKANKLDPDGSAGPATQPVLFALASGSSVSGSTGSSSSGSSSSSSGAASATGTLRTISQVNLRKYGSTGSARLASVPKNVNLSYTDVYTASNGVKWYQVRYAGQTGWVMGTFVNVTSGSSNSSGSSSSSGTVTGGIGTLKSISQVNLRKYASTGSARLASVPKGTTLAYTDTYVDSKGITWYEVRYASQTGWVMGTYVSASGSSSSGSSSSGSSSTGVSIGTVTITKPSTRVRDAADGDKTGYVLSKDSVVDLLAMPVSAGGYTWYNIRTSSGLIGWVRGDCATASIGSSSGSLVVSTDKKFVKLPAATSLFKTETKPTEGSVTVPAGTVLMMYSADTYSVSDVKYCTLYYNNEKYNAVYSEVSGGIMSTEDVNDYMNELLNTALPYTLKRELDLVGDVRVYALQVALERLSYYTGKLDGDYGAGTQSAVRNFQRAAKIEVDGECGNGTWTALNKMLNGGSGSSGSTTVTSFGQVNKVVKANWETINGGSTPVFKRGTYATVMVWDDAGKEYVFNVYRWAGSNHADCVPATVQDTITMCQSVGFNFDGSHPGTDALNKIKNDVENNPNYTWPDFNGNLGGKDIGSKWDRRPALVNINGTVYPASIYGYPHGFNDSSFNKATFPSGIKFYSANSYYGMMCLHFYGSTTHGGNTMHADHEKAMDTAYNKAKSKWPELCK